MIATFESEGPSGDGDVSLSVFDPLSLIDEAELETEIVFDGEDWSGWESTEDIDGRDFIEVLGGTKSGTELNAEGIVVFDEAILDEEASDVDVPLGGGMNSGGGV